MKPSISAEAVVTGVPADTLSASTRIFRSLVISQLKKIRFGEIRLREKNQDQVFGCAHPEFPLRVTIDVHDSSVWKDVALGGSSGSGEAYMNGSWSCDDLVALMRIFVRNHQALSSLDKRSTRLKKHLFKVMHWLNKNSRSGSRRNISAHYDLGNEFFSLFLDPTLMYSSAIYPSAGASLEDAAVFKLDRIAQKLRLSQDDHVLEIGTGWGGFAIHAAKHYGCSVTTTTISREQYALAVKRVKDEGLEHRITVLMKDYRDLTGQFDKLVSIEMVEAVGHQYLDTYFTQCARLLKPDGAMLLQAITMTDQRYESAVGEVDFIKRFIFPGGFLPSITRLSDAICHYTDKKIINIEDIGTHYARTLADWRNRFQAKLQDVKALGYSDSFIRMWEFYLCYCQAGFMERRIGTVQMLLIKPENRTVDYVGTC